MSKLKARFDAPDAGWVMLTVEPDNSPALVMRASHIYDCFTSLTRALLRLWDESGEQRVTLLSAPDEYDLRFVGVNNTVLLTIEHFPDHQRTPSLAKSLLSISGTYNEICVPFWRALKGVQGRFSEDELKLRWKKPFPSRELDILTKTIRS